MSPSAPKHGDHGVGWWVGWITLTILTFFAASAFWTPFIAKHVGSMDTAAAPILWVTAVFGSWMVLLVPLIVVMYNKVDRAYEDARIRRETLATQRAVTLSPLKSVWLAESDRQLSRPLVKKINKMAPAVKRGHLVTAHLKDGRKIDHVFVLDKSEVMGVYGYEKAPFKAGDIVDVTEADLDHLPAFKTEGWLRFDGAGQKKQT